MNIVIRYNPGVPHVYFETKEFYLAHAHSQEALNKFLTELFPAGKTKVFLISHKEEIFVTDNSCFAFSLFDYKYKKSTKNHFAKFYVMLFDTFQDAYQTANIMRSTDPKAFSQ